MKITLFKMDAGLTKPGLFARQCFAEHLGLGYIASMLIQEGHDVKLMYQDSSPSVFTRKIIDTKPDILCATSMTYTHPITRDILNLVKSELPNLKTIVGGDHVSGWLKSVDDSAIDFIVRGEGEDTIVDLVRAIENGEDTSEIPGIGYYKEGVRKTSDREKRMNLDELPFPHRTEEILDNTAFFSVMDPAPSQIRRLSAVIGSRGCPFNCDQCGSKNTLGSKARWRSAKKVADEIESVISGFGTNMLVFYDLTFNLRKDRVLELCGELTSRGVQKNVKWYTIARVANNSGKAMLDRDMLQAMYDAGCRKLGFGIETFDEGLQRSYNKSLDTGVLEETLQIADEIGILSRGFMMLSPDETQDSIDAAKRLLKRLPLYEIRFTCLTPFPGTPFYEQCKKDKRILSDDFSRYASEEIILKPSNFTIQELYKARLEIFREFMNSPEYQARVRNKIRRNPNFEQGFKEYFELLEKQGVLEWSL
jgi:magnesium-protoporphyrin IX monomethyl ester (oxidative) cyclase